MTRLFRNRLFLNTLWSSGGNALMAGVSFIASIFVLRNLGPSEFGILQEMTAYLLVVQNVENFVNPNLFKKDLLQNADRAEQLIHGLGLFIFVFGVTATAVMLAIYSVVDLPGKFLLLIFMLSALCFRCSNGISLYFDSRLETFKGQISFNVGNFIACVYKIGASYARPVALFQALALPIQYFITMGVHLRQYPLRFSITRVKKAEMREILQLAVASLPLFVASFIEIFRTRFPLMYLGSSVSSVDVGYYSAGAKLTEPWIFLLSALSISFWPKLVHAFREASPSYPRILAVYFGVCFYVFGLIAVSGYGLSSFLINHVLGAKYLGSLGVFRIQTWTLLLYAMSFAIGIIEVNEGLSRVSLFRTSIATLICLVGVPAVTPRFGIEGVAWIVLLSTFVSALVLPLAFGATRTILRRLVAAPINAPLLALKYMRTGEGL